MKRTKAKPELTPQAINNKTAMNAHFFNALVMELLVFLQAADHKVTWSYFFITTTLFVVPLLLERILWKKNSDTNVIKYVVAVGFGLLYTYMLFTSTNQLVFVFIIPIVFVLSIYNDVRLSICFTSVIYVENFAAVLLSASGSIPGYLGRDYGIIQLIFITLIGVYSFITNRTLQDNFKLVFQNLSTITSEMKSGIEDVNEELTRLNEASATTINAMQEVSTGTTDTAEAVQSQLLQTQEIQHKVDLVSESTIQITDHMQETLSILKQGNKNVSVLVEKVDASVESGVVVEEKLHILEQSVAEMNTIVEFISRIARETNLLSLNARIEASHAGQLGKGFAVVASEIAEMATQTKDATTNITELIDNISSVITEVVTVIHEMIDDIREEKQSTDSTADSFSAIQESTISVRDNLELLSIHIRDLKEANNLIADSVQTISAVSEEVSAHATETTTAEEENAAILTRIDERMQTLLAVINK